MLALFIAGRRCCGVVLCCLVVVGGAFLGHLAPRRHVDRVSDSSVYGSGAQLDVRGRDFQGVDRVVYHVFVHICAPCHFSDI